MEEDGEQRVLFGVSMSPEVYAIALVYFVQGVIGLSRLAKDFYLKDELHLGPSETALILSVSQAPWLIKPLWGFLSDSVPIFGYRTQVVLDVVRGDRVLGVGVDGDVGGRAGDGVGCVYARFSEHRV
jgi:hypothetical protein